MAGGRAALGGRTIIIALLTTLAAPVLGYMAVRNAAMDLAGSAADPTATLPPRSVTSQVKVIMRTARQPEKPVPAGSIATARRAAVKSPLAYEPYFIAARVEEQAGRFDQATLLMEEARRRRPNATSIHVALLGYYSLADAYQKAIDAADSAMRINGGTTALIMPAFAKLVATDAKARAAIAVALAKRPPWRDDFFVAAINAKITPDVAKLLVADVRRLSPSTTPQSEETFLVRTLVGAGEYRDARDLWASYAPAGPPSSNEVVNPNFRAIPSIPPFAWSLRSGPDGTAEFGKVGEGERPLLEVDYFGDAEIVLAEQTLAVRAGNWRLSSLVMGTSSAPDVRLVWRLTCLPSGLVLKDLPLQPLGERLARREVAVAIPSSRCQGQMLTLLGLPGDISRTLSAQVAEVSLIPAVPPRRTAR